MATKLKLWKSPDNYMGEEYPDYYVLPFGRNRDSTLVEESNFHTALKQLGGESKTVITPRASHWAVGWVEPLMVHKDDRDAVAAAEKLVEQYEQYPLLDEDDYSRRETEAALANIKTAGHKYGLTDREASDIYRWMYQHGIDTSNTDDTGFYPSDDDLSKAVKAIRRTGTRSAKRTQRIKHTPKHLRPRQGTFKSLFREVRPTR